MLDNKHFFCLQLEATLFNYNGRRFLNVHYKFGGSLGVNFRVISLVNDVGPQKQAELPGLVVWSYPECLLSLNFKIEFVLESKTDGATLTYKMCFFGDSVLV